MAESSKQYVFGVPKSFLELKEEFDYPIYAKINNKSFTVLVDKNSKYDKTTCDFYQKEELTQVFINTKDKIKYQADIENLMSDIVNNDSFSSEVKATLIKDLAKETVRNLFEDEVTPEALKSVDNILTSKIEFILKDELAIKSLLKVVSYDYYTSTHCIDVATYALGFGCYLKLPKKDLKTLGKAALLHDLGKRRVSKDIICKNGKLTKEEFEIVKSHPKHSVDILKEQGETNTRLIKIVEQHHEKCDGSGYPYGLKANEIDEFAKILAICDIFNALTTKRTYKEKLDKYEAYMIMYEKMQGHISYYYLKKFLEFLKVT